MGKFGKDLITSLRHAVKHARQQSETKKQVKAGEAIMDRHRLTMEALADVDNGRVVDHKTVQAWAKSKKKRAGL